MGRSWVLALVMAMAGCSRSPTMYEVSGTVSYDGQPVAKGDISFVPLEPHLGPDATAIENGKFYLRAKAGKKNVAIRAVRPSNKKLSPEAVKLMGEQPLYEDYIPAKYNSKTELTAEVSSGKENIFTFDLKK